MHPVYSQCIQRGNWTASQLHYSLQNTSEVWKVAMGFGILAVKKAFSSESTDEKNFVEGPERRPQK